MAVLVNLLPDVKQARLKSQKRRRFAVGITILIVIIAVAIPILLLVARGAQTVLINRTQGSIDKRVSELQSTPNLETILTTQAHLKSLPPLYAQRLFPTNFFNTLPNVLPTSIRLTGIELTTNGSVRFSGRGDNYAAVQKYVASLQTAEYAPPAPAAAPVSPLEGTELGQGSEPANSEPARVKLFNTVTLETIASDSSSGGVTFVISAGFDPGVVSAKTE